MIDLHTHSTASDGELTPEQLVLHAQTKGISVLALTDHDTVAGLDRAEKQAAECGITFVRGIELNIEVNRGEFHLLGLGLGQISKSLDKLIAKLQAGREDRNRSMISKMKADGLPVDYDELLQMFSLPCLGRPHIAAYMVEKNIVKKRQQAFDKYLAQGRPYYVDREGADLFDAVEAINDSGGIPVLAHPLSLYLSWGKLEPVLADHFESGIRGLEAWHPGTKVGEAIRLEELARKLGFFVTGGSDFHGEHVRADRKIGHTAGMKKIEDRFWTDELLPNLQKMIQK